MFILFIFLGAGEASIFVCIPVLLFRLYPNKGQQRLFALTVLHSAGSMIMPILIELSQNKTDHYLIPLWILSGLGFLFVFIVIFLPTPQHDDLRTIKRKLSK